MPTLQKPLSLTITPEQFINACSRTELIELDLLLSSSRVQNIINKEPKSDKSQESDEFRPNHLLEFNLKKTKPKVPPALLGRHIGDKPQRVNSNKIEKQ